MKRVLLPCLVALVACSSTDEALAPDAGDAGTHSFGDGSVACAPRDIPGFTPRPYKPPLPGGVCTPSQIAAYAACSGDRSTPACAQILDAEGKFLPSFQQCGPCIETNLDDAAWGAIVISDPGTRSGFYNLAGCFGKRAGDGASTQGCGAAIRALEECWRTACIDCKRTGIAGDVRFRDTCLEAASKGTCAAFDRDFEAKCTTVIHDGVTAEACGGKTNATDAEFLTALVTQMCGGAPERDAGGD